MASEANQVITGLLISTGEQLKIALFCIKLLHLQSKQYMFLIKYDNLSNYSNEL